MGIPKARYDAGLCSSCGWIHTGITEIIYRIGTRAIYAQVCFIHALKADALQYLKLPAIDNTPQEVASMRHTIRSHRPLVERLGWAATRPVATRRW